MFLGRLKNLRGSDLNIAFTQNVHNLVQWKIIVFVDEWINYPYYSETDIILPRRLEIWLNSEFLSMILQRLQMFLRFIINFIQVDFCTR